MKKMMMRMRVKKRCFDLEESFRLKEKIQKVKRFEIEYSLIVGTTMRKKKEKRMMMREEEI